MWRDALLTTEQLDRDSIATVLNHAADIDTGGPSRSYDDTILGLCFFEPSTRTKMSFNTAMKRLGGDIVDMGHIDMSSVQKGESLADTVRVIEGYADAIVLRHPKQGAAKMASEHVDVPIINAGDGAGHHPTQTLLDLYTILDNATLDDLTIGIMGDLKYGRTVHSLATALTEFDADQRFISPDSLRIPERVRHALRDADATISEHRSLEAAGLEELDVLYVTRIQKERFPDEDEYREVAGEYQIDAATLDAARDDLTVMHPLPRVDEIAPDIDDTQHAAYFEQAHNGVPVRMALLDLMLAADTAAPLEVTSE